MSLTYKEKKMLNAIREAGTDITFLLIHLSNMYDRQEELDTALKRPIAVEMKRRSDIYYQAYHDVMGIRSKKKGDTILYLVK